MMNVTIVQMINPGLISSMLYLWLLGGEDDANDFCEQRHPFDKGSRDNHCGTHLTGDFRLAAAGFHRCRGELPDAYPRPDDAQPGPDATCKIC
jgi:hypothetical protein